MEIISCCGVVCSDCEYYPEVCKGCPAIKGKAFWLEYTNESICSIYECCIEEKKLEHCGLCKEFPCFRYIDANDPTKTKEENERILLSQIRILESMK